jgi:hypothetical protein
MMGTGGVALARRAGLVAARIAVIALAGALHVAPARAATADLTGYWVNVAAPTAPGWSLQATAGLSKLHGDWHGTAAQGHPTLAGSFDATVNSTGNAYSGRYDIKESGDHPGDVIVTIHASGRITVTLEPDGGGSTDIDFQKGVASAMPAAHGWCASAGSADPSCQTDPTTIAPGSEAIEPSADLTASQQSASFAVTGDDPSATTAVVATPPPNTPTPLHAADCVKVAGVIVSATGAFRVEFGTADWQQIRSESGGPNAVLFAYALLACLDVIHEQDAGSPADVARVACPVSADKINDIKVGRANAPSVKFTVKRGRVAPPLSVSCTRKNGKLIVHVRTRSKHQTLRQILGRKLLVGIYHSSKASKIELASVAFAKH